VWEHLADLQRCIACTCALALAEGCGTATDDRPQTAAYISAAILVPYCGRAACHSTATRAHDLNFGSVADSIATMQSQFLVVAGDPTTSPLVTVLTATSRVMPPDTPLPDADIELITRWVADGAEGLP
jgi:hypothetical protein